MITGIKTFYIELPPAYEGEFDVYDITLDIELEHALHYTYSNRSQAATLKSAKITKIKHTINVYFASLGQNAINYFGLLNKLTGTPNVYTEGIFNVAHSFSEESVTEDFNTYAYIIARFVYINGEESSFSGYVNYVSCEPFGIGGFKATFVIA